MLTMTLHLKKISFIALALVLFAPTLVLAQSSLSFSVSPTIFDMTGDPGQTWQSNVRVINANPYDLTVYTNVVNFRPKEESGVPQFLYDSSNLESPANFASWVTVPQEIQIPPERTVELPIQISVPEDASPGGHYAAILIGTRPPETDADAPQVETSQIISTLMFMRVSGEIDERASIRSFRTTDYIVNRPETTFELRIENKGNVYLQPRGEIVIHNMWGQERGRIPVNQQTLFGNVLSNSVRKFSFDWKGEWSPAEIGRYTAEVTLAYGADKKQFMSFDTAFWVFPWKLVLVVLIILVAFFKLFTWAIKSYVNRMLALSGVSGELGVQAIPIEKKMSVTAPLEAGMLDLRERLSTTTSFLERFKVFSPFIKQYWKFFVVILGAIVFIALVIMYFVAVLQPSREYEVTTESGEVVNREQIEAEPEPIEDMAVSTELGEPVITVVNRTNDAPHANYVAELLEADGISISEVVNDNGPLENRTVIVFSPSVTEKALLLSARLNNAPLSALPEIEINETPEITIYLGTDSLTIKNTE